MAQHQFLQSDIEKIKEFEGCRLSAYRDSGGTWTIGHGHVSGVKSGQKISLAKAEEYLRQDLEIAGKQVESLGVCKTYSQYISLTDFTFNLGIKSLKSSTLLELIKAGANKDAVQAQFRRWVFCKGKKLQGLVKRREWEARRYYDEV